MISSLERQLASLASFFWFCVKLTLRLSDHLDYDPFQIMVPVTITIKRRGRNPGSNLTRVDLTRRRLPDNIRLERRSQSTAFLGIA